VVVIRYKLLSVCSHVLLFFQLEELVLLFSEYSYTLLS
jgi:hypothetical protein